MRWRLLIATIAAAAAVAMPVHSQVRVAFFNVAGLQGSNDAIAHVIAEIHADQSRGFAIPADVLVFTEVRQVNLAPLIGIVNAAAPPGVSYSLGTFTTSPSEDQATGANAIFLRNGRVFELPAGHKDIFTGAGRNTDRWWLQLVGYSSPQARFYVYGSHLRASSGSANEQQRLEGVQAIRTDADALPANTPIIYTGDMNFYTANESGYQWWISVPGNGIAVDVQPGEWTGIVNAIKHTQSPRSVTGGGLIGGGMDDRFDMHLFSTTMVDGAGLAVIPDTYRSFGNDGLKWKKAINDGNNFYFPGQLARSNALADALFDASDHVPVVVDLQLPAVHESWLAAQPGKVIRNASVAVELRTWNAVSVVSPLGVDPLSFVAVGQGVVVGNVSAQAPIQPNFSSWLFPVNTSVVGPLNGGVLVTTPNEAAQNSALQLPVIGSVVRPANASFSPNTKVASTTASFSIPSGDGVVELPVSVFNFNFDSNQAMLDVDATNLQNGHRAFSVMQGSSFGIGSTPGTVKFGFNLAGLTPGTYSRQAFLTCTDENIPGEEVSFLSLTLSVTVTPPAIPGDLNGDGVVNGADLAVLLGQWGTAGSADLNGDGVVNGADVAILLGFWS